MSDCGGDPNCPECRPWDIVPVGQANECGPACYDSEAKAREARRYEAHRKNRVRHKAQDAGARRKARRRMQKLSRKANRR